VAAFAGTGKTSLARMFPERVIDFVCMPYKYELSGGGECDPEGCKADSSGVIRSEWPYNYVEAILDLLGGGKVILIPSDLKTLSLLAERRVRYLLCFPERELVSEYRNRFVERGNSKEFLDVFIGGWDRFLNALDSDSWGDKIVMKSGEFLSDVFGVSR
jgi:hypothetical protein